jgi:cell division protein FtsL
MNFLNIRKKEEFSEVKKLSRKYLTRQNLIFIIIAIIIVLILISVIISQLSFLIREINKGIGIDKKIETEAKSFDIEGFNEIKDKIIKPSILD